MSFEWILCSIHPGSDLTSDQYVLCVFTSCGVGWNRADWRKDFIRSYPGQSKIYNALSNTVCVRSLPLSVSRPVSVTEQRCYFLSGRLSWQRQAWARGAVSHHNPPMWTEALLQPHGLVQVSTLCDASDPFWTFQALNAFQTNMNINSLFMEWLCTWEKKKIFYDQYKKWINWTQI